MGANPAKDTSWPHAPSHRLSADGTYFLTAGTYRKLPYFAGKERLKALHDGLLKYADLYGWTLEAWAVFPNHYHFVAHSPPSLENDESSGAKSLPAFLSHFHSRSARWVNQLDESAGRKIWHNYRETQLTYEKSYYARLHYVHANPVHHGLVREARLYPWCSARWFERVATPAQVRTVYRFKTDQLTIPDDY